MALSNTRIKVDPESIRKQRGISQEELADKTNIARTTLRRLLKHPGKFTLDQFAAVCDVLDIPDEAIRVAS